jgi:hypothetical protein
MNWAGRALVAGLATAAMATAAMAAGTVAATPAQASPLRGDEPRLLAVDPTVLYQDRQQWVHAFWLGVEKVCDFRLTADGPGMLVGYPANTATYTSFYRSDSIGRLEPDYTALNLTGTRAGHVPLRLHLAYKHRAADGTCGGKVSRRELTTRIAVLPR